MEAYFKLQFFKEIFGFILIGGYIVLLVVAIIVNTFFGKKDNEDD